MFWLLSIVPTQSAPSSVEEKKPTWPLRIPQIVQKLKTCGAEGLTLRFTLSFKVTL